MSRAQLALNVSDLPASIAFYSTLFGVEPHKLRPGYANFIVTEPPLKLVLIEVPGSERGTGPAGALNHLGVEVADSATVVAHADRLSDAGLATFDETDTTCCYARQDKVWVHDPAGTPWEVYTVTDDNPADARPAAASLPLAASASGTGCCTTGTAAPAHAPVAAGCCATMPPEEIPVTTIRVFEPALCCNTGVCGPDVDEALVAFTADLAALREQGVDIERHNLANDPGAFAADDSVRAFLQVAGSAGLPLTLVDGVTVMTGTYPAREQLLRFAGATAASPDAAPDIVPSGANLLNVSEEADACCGGTACC